MVDLHALLPEIDAMQRFPHLFAPWPVKPEKTSLIIIGYATTGEAANTYYSNVAGLRFAIAEMMDEDGIDRIMVHHISGAVEPLEIIRWNSRRKGLATFGRTDVG